MEPVGKGEQEIEAVLLTGSAVALGMRGTLLLNAAVGLFDTEDARGGIQTFLESGREQTLEIRLPLRISEPPREW
jgi:hypothetical protein